MKLLVDLGNTRLKWLQGDPAAPAARGEVAVGGGDRDRVLSEAWPGLARPDAVWASSVAAPEAREAVTRITTRLWGLSPQWVIAAREYAGVRNGYTDAASLGSDRWLAIIAAYREIRGAVCVVDCGTAVTIDAIDAGGNHRGGAIVPGLALMRRALLERTAQIREAGQEAAGALGRTTGDAVSGGTLLGLAGAIGTLVAAQREVIGQAAPVLLCGGDAPRLMPVLGVAGTIHAPDLVFHGLAMVSEAAC